MFEAIRFIGLINCIVCWHVIFEDTICASSYVLQSDFKSLY